MLSTDFISNMSTILYIIFFELGNDKCTWQLQCSKRDYGLSGQCTCARDWRIKRWSSSNRFLWNRWPRRSDRRPWMRSRSCPCCPTPTSSSTMRTFLRIRRWWSWWSMHKVTSWNPTLIFFLLHWLYHRCIVFFSCFFYFFIWYSLCINMLIYCFFRGCSLCINMLICCFLRW